MSHVQRRGPADPAVFLLHRTRDLMLECRRSRSSLRQRATKASAAESAEQIPYGVLVAALEKGLVNTLQHAMEVLSHFSAPAGLLGEEWLKRQERRFDNA